MASKNLFIMIIFVAITIVTPTIATDYVVGDYSGWRVGVNYTIWAEGKQFYLGDRLIFNYGEGAHNIYRVNGTNFQQCMIPSDVVPLTTGNDIITLATPGRKWYICGVGSHCTLGMRLVITVSSTEAPASAPNPATGTSGSNTLKSLQSCVWSFAIFACFLIISA